VSDCRVTDGGDINGRIVVWLMAVISIIVASVSHCRVTDGGDINGHIIVSHCRVTEPIKCACKHDMRVLLCTNCIAPRWAPHRGRVRPLFFWMGVNDRVVAWLTGSSIDEPFLNNYKWLLLRISLNWDVWRMKKG
jgi:hypothetical protein